MVVNVRYGEVNVGDEIPAWSRTTDFMHWNRYAAVNDEFVYIHMDDEAGRGEDQPLDGKPVAIVSASPGPLGGARVQYDLRKVLLFVNAMPLVKPEVFIGGAAGKFDAQTGACTDATTRDFVTRQMAAFADWIAGVQRMRGSAAAQS